MKVYGINTCGTYKKAIKFFIDNNIDFEAINLRETVITKTEMASYHKLSGLDIKKFFNTSGKVYKELGIKDKYQLMTQEEIYSLLVNNPMLIKRPLVVDGDYVRTGFKEEEYINQWLHNE